MMCINSDYRVLLKAIKKIKADEKLSKKEKETIIEVLDFCKGRIYPTEDEMNRHIKNVNRNIQTIKTIKQMEEFELKYY